MFKHSDGEPSSNSSENRRALRRTTRRRMSAGVATVAVSAGLFLTGTTAEASIVPTVQLGASANYSVLAGSTVTNTGGSTLAESLGLWPGPSVTGFPPGLVTAPGTSDVTNAAAQNAQSDLTAAYVDASTRSVEANTAADLGNLTLQPGVYAGPSTGAIGLTGPLVLDGAGNADAVFIFRTDSSLITSSGSTVTLINGAQECNVFWQVGSSATLGTGSVFVGNILALTSITVENSVTVHGRALARNGAVTLDNDTFTSPTCATTTPTTTTDPATTSTTTATTPTTTVATTATTIDSGGATPTSGPGTATTSAGAGSSETVPAPATPISGADLSASTLSPGDLLNVTLPSTGRSVTTTAIPAFFALAIGMLAIRIARRRDPSAD